MNEKRDLAFYGARIGAAWCDVTAAKVSVPNPLPTSVKPTLKL